MTAFDYFAVAIAAFALGRFAHTLKTIIEEIANVKSDDRRD